LRAADRFPRHDLALLYGREKEKGNDRATLPVARKMVAYLLAVGRGKRDFVPVALIVTVRCSLISSARYTSPMPPAPRSDWITYGPNFVPELNAINRVIIPSQPIALEKQN
jgi:hypothetical protein